MNLNRLGFYVLGSLALVAVLATAINVFDWQVELLYGAGTTQTASSTVIVGNAAPTVTSVKLNSDNNITLTANATTAVTVYALISDNNGCTDITTASATILVYRSGVTSSTCLTTQDNQNCYKVTSFTATSTCASNQMNTTATVGIYYFAQPTDATSSEFASQTWMATVIFEDVNNATGTGSSSGVEVISLTALNVTTSSINYGTLAASSTSASNEVTTSTNAGNTSSTISLSANNTLTSGSNSISTSSQHYATTSFTWLPSGGSEVALTASAVHVDGSIMTRPTSTNTVNRAIFWALNVPAGTATGTYTGQTLFTSRYVTSSPL